MAVARLAEMSTCAVSAAQASKNADATTTAPKKIAETAGAGLKPEKRNTMPGTANATARMIGSNDFLDIVWPHSDRRPKMSAR